jgi:GT2 family glycosyltransferase
VKWLSEYSGNFGENIVPVTVVDGLIFGVNKQKIKARFDETIKGFHMYDIDFCIANFLGGVKIGVLFNFNITHKSIGQTNQEWETNRYQVANKYDGKLPLSVDPVLFAEKRNVKIKKQPFVSIIIPTKGKVELVYNLLTSIKKTSYQNYEVIIADTGSIEKEKNSLKEMIMDMATIKEINVRMVEYDYYHFAKINNDVVKNHLDPRSELVMFCNNDVVFVNDCLSLMVDTYLKNRHTCGTVGARLHFENNKVQHAGIFITKTKDHGLSAGHVGYNTPYQYQNKTYTVVGNTAALLLISKNLFEKLGGFNELYAHCFEDVELNLQALIRRCTNYMCGEAVAYHLESQTREPGIGMEDLEKLNLFMNNNMDKLAKYLIEQ